MSVRLSAQRAELAAADTPLLAIALGKPVTLSGPVQALDTALGGIIARAIARQDFRGSRDE